MANNQGIRTPSAAVLVLGIVSSGVWAQGPLVASVLPTSRAVSVNSPATAFATIINADPDAADTATGCSISPATAVPADFLYQTTDSTTNALMGTRNTPVDIPGAEGSQSFLIAFTPTTAFPHTEVELLFDCDNTDPVTTIVGVNTLGLSASNDAVPDMIAVAVAEGSEPGIADVSRVGGTGVFAVATTNVGMTGTITATADTGDGSPPVNLRLCQIDPMLANCINPNMPTTDPVVADVSAGEMPAYGVFVQATGEVVDDPATSRAFLRLSTDNSGGVYDDFSAATIDSAKWLNREFVRRVRNGVLESSLRRFGVTQSNNLLLASPGMVTSLQADVTVTEMSNSNATPRARLVGRFYDDGTLGGGETGNIVAQNAIRAIDGNLQIFLAINRCEDPDCDVATPLFRDTTSFGPVNLNETHTLLLAWDGAGVFTFGFDAGVVNVDPTADAPVAGPASDPRKAIGTRIGPTPTGVIGVPGEGTLAPSAGGSIAATFDNVVVNAVAYDDFSAPTIDPTRWDTYEFVRQVSNGVLESEITRLGSDGRNALDFADPNGVNAFQADVNVTAVNVAGSLARASIGGLFYNDGTPGGGFAGDIQAEIRVRDNGSGLLVDYFVSRCDNPGCTIFTTTLFDTTTFGPVNLGETHTLSLGWNGTDRFTFGFDNQSDTFDPTGDLPVAGPANVPIRRIGTRITGIDSDLEGGSITARFDNVAVTDGAVNTISRGSTSVAIRTVDP